MTMLLLSFGENIEIEAYMLWPGLVLLGIHLREVSLQATGKSANRQGAIGNLNRPAFAGIRLVPLTPNAQAVPAAVIAPSTDEPTL